ncbi:MAG: hypothetical protein FWG10_10500 [Eubacteriaceae bacterium]|nr:hypothetical protein [Eubacteriaceae bacterium]
MKKKTAVAIAIIFAFCLVSGCKTRTLTGNNGGGETPGNNIQLDNWAWALTDGNYETAGRKLAAIEYMSPDTLGELAIAVGPNTLANVEFQGQKEGNSSGDDFYYYPIFENMTGPFWSLAINESLPTGSNYYIIVPAPFKDALIGFEPSSEENNNEWGFDDNHGHPGADAANTATIQSMYPDRMVRSTELLATDSSGGNVSLYQFENKDNGMFVLAYINGDKVVVSEYETGLWGGEAVWRADAEGDNICLFEVAMIAQTGSGTMLATVWYGPEGADLSLLQQNEGVFEAIPSRWLYDLWGNEYYEDSGN